MLSDASDAQSGLNIVGYINKVKSIRNKFVSWSVIQSLLVRRALAPSRLVISTTLWYQILGEVGHGNVSRFFGPRNRHS